MSRESEGGGRRTDGALNLGHDSACPSSSMNRTSGGAQAIDIFYLWRWSMTAKIEKNGAHRTPRLRRS